MSESNNGQKKNNNEAAAAIAVVGILGAVGLLAYLAKETQAKKTPPTSTPSTTTTTTITTTTTTSITLSVSSNTDYVGQPVTLTATTNDPSITTIYFWAQDPSGNWSVIGQQSVTNGQASISFTPESPGTYSIVASNEGSTAP
jgi:hypothetical protein